MRGWCEVGARLAIVLYQIYVREEYIIYISSAALRPEHELVSLNRLIPRETFKAG